MVVGLEDLPFARGGVDVWSYSAFLRRVQPSIIEVSPLEDAERQVNPSDVLTLQFTSGEL